GASFVVFALRAVVDGLRIDDDFRTSPRLDRVDGRLGLDDLRWREDAGVVVDRPVDLRIRERRARWDPLVFGRRLRRTTAGARGTDRRLHDLAERRQQRVIELLVRE